MTQEHLKEANRITSRLNSLVIFKTDLKTYMEEESGVGYVSDICGLNRMQGIWHRLLRHFTPKFCKRDDAPILDPDISDPDGLELYKDLCAVADKWIDIYEKRLEEL